MASISTNSNLDEENRMPPLFPPIEMGSKELSSSSDEPVRIPSIIHLAMDFKKLSIRELLECCLRTNDQRGWEEFVERITPTISGVAYNHVNSRGRRDPGAIQDYVQKTLLKLFDRDKRALREFIPEHENSFYGYVKTITRNVVLDDIRKPDRNDPMEEALKSSYTGAFSERGLVGRMQCIEVEARLEKLTADQTEKDIFWFFFRAGYTAREIAEMPGINLSTKRVETILSRLVRQLRRGTGAAATG